MRRAFCLAVIGLALVGCQITPDPQRNLQPLPVDGPVLTYNEVVQRARSQAMIATEAFYVDQWADVERAAISLEDTARYLPRALEIPTANKASVEARATSLGREATALRTAVKSRDEKKTNEIMQRINLLVRELRPE
jgi:hypothetical protein